MVKVTCQINAYDFRGEPTTSIKVHNHWNESKAVEIEIEDKRIKVYAKDLITAIENATNTNRH